MRRFSSTFVEIPSRRFRDETLCGMPIICHKGKFFRLKDSRIDLKAGAETSSSKPFQKFLSRIGYNSDLSGAQTVI